MGILGRKEGAGATAFQVTKNKKIVSIDAENISKHLMRCPAKIFLWT